MKRKILHGHIAHVCQNILKTNNPLVPFRFFSPEKGNKEWDSRDQYHTEDDILEVFD